MENTTPQNPPISVPQDIKIFQLSTAELLQHGLFSDSSTSRLDFLTEKIDSVIKNIDRFKKYGQTHPILVATLPETGQYRILDGHHRFIAAVVLNWPFMWAIDESCGKDPLLPAQLCAGVKLQQPNLRPTKSTKEKPTQARQKNPQR